MCLLNLLLIHLIGRSIGIRRLLLNPRAEPFEPEPLGALSMKIEDHLVDAVKLVGRGVPEHAGSTEGFIEILAPVRRLLSECHDLLALARVVASVLLVPLAEQLGLG